jgi:ribosomal protein S18 acetylase RimI-like enzyme
LIDVWILERIFREAWPAHEEHESGGWLARLTGGGTRRPNAINPVSREAGGVIEALEKFGDLYRHAGLRQIVRLPDFCKEADHELAAAGYLIEATTRTIAADLNKHRVAHDPELELASRPSRGWVEAFVGPQGDPVTEALLERLSIPAIFASVKRGGEFAAIGYVAIDQDIAVIESIRTVPAFRRQGLGRVCVSALMTAASEAGARSACLQVEATNIAGLALYANLGFDRHLYDYHYRVPA